MKFFLWFLFLFLLPANLIFSQKEESEGTFSGHMFGDYFYNINRDTSISSIPNNTLSGQKDLNGFQIRKIYFTYDADITEEFTTRFRLDAEPETKLPNGKMGVALKDAYLKWKNIFSGSDFYFGLQPTPAFYTTVDFWGYRLLEESPLDLRNIVPSRDIAVSLKGKLDLKGIFNYWLQLGNGTGNADFDKYKRIYAHLHLIPSESFKIILYGDIKFKPEINYRINDVSSDKLNNNIYTTDLFFGYSIRNTLRIGVEGFIQKISNGYYIISGTSTIYKTKDTFGFSVFQVYSLGPLFDIIGRYDYYDDNLSAGSRGDSRNYFIFGFSYKPNPDVSITPNILVETYEKSLNNKYYKPSVTARITFFYSYHK
ncbi:MAG: hypothetical protein WAM24_20765 [Ignavibacteriaceae bacterium]